MRRDRLGLSGSGLLLATLFTATVLTATVGAPAAGPPVPSATPGARALSAEAAYGARLFTAKGCAVCHALGAAETVVAGPSLERIAATAGTRRPGLSAEAYLRESIRQPQAFSSPIALNTSILMPTLEVSEPELDALVAFLLAPR